MNLIYIVLGGLIIINYLETKEIKNMFNELQDEVQGLRDIVGKVAVALPALRTTNEALAGQVTKLGEQITRLTEQLTNDENADALRLAEEIKSTEAALKEIQEDLSNAVDGVTDNGGGGTGGEDGEPTDNGGGESGEPTDNGGGESGEPTDNGGGEPVEPSEPTG